MAGLTLVITDSTGSTDTLALARGLVITDSTGLTDTRVLGSNNLKITLTDSAGSTDTRSFDRGLVLQDSIASSDTVAPALNGITLNFRKAFTFTIDLVADTTGPTDSGDPIPASGGVVQNSTMVFTPSMGKLDITDPYKPNFGGVHPSTNPIKLPRGVRAAPTVRLTVPDPAIISGRPWVPQFWMQSSASANLTEGSGHIESIPDPPPPTSSASTWPKGKKPDYWWTVNDMGTPTGSGYSVSRWDEHFSAGPSWFSKSVYRPRLANHISFGPGGRFHTYTKALHFDQNNVEHMWLDFGGSPLVQPYTVMMCGIINSYPNRRYGHYLMDAGIEQPVLNVQKDWNRSDGLTYRNVMLYQLSSAILCTRKVVEDGVYARCTHNYKPRPRVFTGIFHGNNSYIGYHDPGQNVLRHGRVDVKTVQHLVIGRRADYISDNLASHMTLFEIRIFRSHLSNAELAAHYAQMAATYKFSLYTRAGD